MALGFVVLFIFFYLFYNSSVHIIVLLLCVEFLVLSVFMMLLNGGVSIFSCLIFILIGVCLGAYAVSLLISLSRSKVSSYFLSANFF